jgi:hypothetical protein
MTPLQLLDSVLADTAYYNVVAIPAARLDSLTERGVVQLESRHERVARGLVSTAERPVPFSTVRSDDR